MHEGLRGARCFFLYFQFFILMLTIEKAAMTQKNSPILHLGLNLLSTGCTSTFSISFWYAGLSAFTGESSNGPGSERRSYWRGQEQARCCDQGEICQVFSVL